MKKLIVMSFLFIPLFSFLFLLFSTDSAFASSNTVTSNTYISHDNLGVSPSVEIGPTYPNGVAIQPGDLIYTTATVSTFLVGHIGIVGPDYAVYHSHPYGPGKRDSLQSYITNFSVGDPFTVLRVRNGGGLQAGTWAKNNINRLKSYSFNIYTDNIADNYCSKFVWQAYWYGVNKDISDTNVSGAIGHAQFIGPNQINISSKVIKVTSFNR